MEHKKISCKLKSGGQMARLYQNIMSGLRTVQEAKESLGYDCFTEDSEERIEMMESLKKLYKFSATLEDFNEELQKLFDSAQCDKAARRLKAYIKMNIKGV